jgi:coenzyme Q-binding protein COQ10
MPVVQVTETVRGNAKDVYTLIQDMESYPRFMENLNSVHVLERGDNWTLTAWDTTLNGMRFCWQEHDEFDHVNHRIQYRQVSGDMKKFEGSWIVEQDGEVSKVTLVVDFEFGVPMLSSLLNPVAKIKLKHNGESMLKAIKRRFEAEV